MKRAAMISAFVLALAALRLPAAELGPLFEVGQASIQPFSTWAYGYGALTSDRRHVAAYVAASDGRKILIGARADIRLDDAVASESTVSGTVASVLPDADPRTHQSIVTIRLAPQDLPARTYAHVQIEVSARQTLGVPTDAIVWQEGHAIVFRQNKKGEWEPVTIEVGQQNPSFTEIKSGLATSDRILTEGAAEWAFKESGGGEGD